MNGATAPGVVLWQRVYCVAMAAVYLLMVVLAMVMWLFPEQLSDGESPSEMRFVAAILAAVSLPLAAIYAVGPFLPRRRWAWVWHLVLIAIGLTSCACVPFCVPLLVFWIRPDAQAWYGGPTT